MTRTGTGLLLAGAAIAALAVPSLLVRAVRSEGQAPAPVAATIAEPRPPAALALDRPLFTSNPASRREPELRDAPALVGVVGRLPDDGVALVTTSAGKTRSMRIGDVEGGWTLLALDPGGASFGRGTERLRVSVPVGP
jgi:hypothetical protein